MKKTMNENKCITTKKVRNRAEYSCTWCGKDSRCENRHCEMNGLQCDGSRVCNNYRENIYDKEIYAKPKRWHKVKTMYDTYLPNARYC